MFLTKPRFVGLILVSFFLGCLATAAYQGSFLESHPRKRGMRSSHRLMDKLSVKLELTAVQKGHLEKVLEEGRRRMVDLGRSMKPSYQEIKLETRTRIRELLTSDQAVRFDELMKERDAKRQKRGNGG